MSADLIVSLAALALFDGEAEISVENLDTLIEATGNKNAVESYMPALFANMLNGRDIEQLLFSGVPTASSGPAAVAGEAAKEEEVVEESETEEESEEGGMGGLFGDSDSDF
eukprot:TRINITY_DN242208_c0_g3_i1.p1 TRINITY_DN242208_c0_g3~~TRINITY_DN242208_c0_g3_i1.p1  ORF type:complete len:111 (-),score=46.65 TRINITY_DN242208_c0_g3_i1:71-403(-)